MPESTHRFLEFKKYEEYQWFRFLIFLLLLITLIYMAAHFLVPETARYEYQKLDKEQLQQINQIYFDAKNKGNEEQVTDSVPKPNDVPIRTVEIRNPDTSLRLKSNKAIDFVQNQFNDKVDSNQLESVRKYLYTSLPLEAISFLGKVRFKVKSYFWLVGPEVYFEIIFWAWFGVIASILFNLGVIGRSKTSNQANEQGSFDSSEIPYQVAKLLYAPLATLAIVLGYNYFTGGNIVDISSSKGVIVFAFIGGFYSARLIAFLDRLKEVLLPTSGTSDQSQQTPSNSVTLKNTTITLALDEATIPAELKPNMENISFNDASVTLKNHETSETIVAVLATDDQLSKFIVGEIKPGTYTIEAKWSKKISNDQLIELAAEQEKAIKVSGEQITVMLKKANSAE